MSAAPIFFVKKGTGDWGLGTGEWENLERDWDPHTSFIRAASRREENGSAFSPVPSKESRSAIHDLDLLR
jgi:hypothetical protein